MIDRPSPQTTAGSAAVPLAPESDEGAAQRTAAYEHAERYEQAQRADLTTPDCASQAREARLAEVLDLVAQRLKHGEPLALASLEAEWPDLAGEIRSMLPVLEGMVQLSSGGRSLLSAAGLDAEPAASAFQLGDFRLLREIGRGGMGIVYEAEQLSLGRRVALKVLPFSGLLDERLKTRFRNEAHAAATLEHPNIVPVFGSGQERGVYYYAMRLIRGRTAAQWIAEIKNQSSGAQRLESGAMDEPSVGPAVAQSREPAPAGAGSPEQGEIRDQAAAPAGQTTVESAGRQAQQRRSAAERRAADAERRSAAVTASETALDTVTLSGSTIAGSRPGGRDHYRRAAEIGVQVAGALHHAHVRGVVHRDIKPSNLLLDEAGHVWVADFGLAAIESAPQLTMTGDLLGTLRYMSPEQASSEREVLDHRTDVYSLGITLYELLALQPAFAQTQRTVMLQKVLEEDPPRLRAIDRRIPTDLETIVHKAVSNDPQLRYLTARDLAEDLTRFLEGRPILARPQHLSQRAVRWMQRNPAATAVMALVALLLLMAGSLLVYDQRLRASARLAEMSDRQIATLSYANAIVNANTAVEEGDIAQAAAILAQYVPEPGAPDARGLEWHYLQALTTREASAEASVGSDVYQVAVSHDRKLVAAACKNGDVRLYQARDLQPVRAGSAGLGELNGVSFSPQDDSLVVAGDSGEVRTLGILSKDTRWRPPILVHPGKAFGAIRLTNNTLITCGDDPVIRIWNTKVENAPAAVLEGHSESVEAIAVSPDGKWLASAGRDRKVFLWDLESRTKRWSTGRLSSVFSVAFSPDSKRLAAAGTDREVVIYDTQRGKTLYWGRHADAVQAVTFRGNGTRLVSGDRGGAIRDWKVPLHDPPGQSELLELDSPEDAWRAHTGTVWSLAPLPGGGFVSAGADGKIRLWRRADPTRLRRELAPTLRDACRQCVISSDGQRIYVLLTLGRVAVLEAGTLTSSSVLNAPGEDLESIALLEDRGQLAAGTASGRVVVWNLKTGQRSSTWPATRGGCSSDCLAYSARAGVLVAASWRSNQVVVLAAATGERRAEFAANGPESLSLSEPAQRLAFHSLNDIVVCDLATFAELQRWPAHSGGINTLAFSPDGKLLASGSEDRTVKVWTAEGKPVTTLHGHRHGVDCVRFTTDGKTLFSGDSGGVVRATNVPTFMHLLEIPTGTSNIGQFELFPDSRRLAIITAESSLVVVGRHE